MPQAVRFVAIPILATVLYFGSAGRLDLPLAWVYVAVLVGERLAVAAGIDPGLVHERIQPGPGGIDRHIRALIFPFYSAHLVVAGLDVRYGWSPIPAALRLAGLLGLLLALTLSVWAIHVNRFFSPVVRIQTDRGHCVVDSGPYRFVRHPGYLAALGEFLFGGLLLGSWWALLPLAGGPFFMLRRTVLEDRYLRESLAGYADYAQRVRYRLVPGVW